MKRPTGTHTNDDCQSYGSARGSPRKRRILLVDDSKTAVMMHQSVLGTLGCEISTAHDGLEAVACATAFRPDLILMDVEMPNMDGFTACMRIREKLGPEVPIILVTTRGTADYVRRGFESGCSGYLTKPVTSLDLLSKARTYLGH